MTHLSSRSLISAIAILLAATVCAHAQQNTPDTQPAPAAAQEMRATPIMPLDDVRIGMKGYGLSVFHGTKIETFPVEVISVMRDFSPQRGVVWIRCPDERMQKSGPVQGMSGSPIYLWADGEAHEPGKGGKLIGAFAFGFSTTKDCYVGVQPIEQMRATGERSDQQKPAQDADVVANSRAGESALKTLHALSTIARREGMRADATWRIAALAKMMQPAGKQADLQTDDLPPAPLAGGNVMPMMLPMAVPSADAAGALAPLLAPAGIRSFQAPMGTAIGMPPHEVDAENIKLEPGSVFAVPLAFGDMDLSASGTVTDVRPDGTVLAFGHAMFGEGEVALPMATGYVHFVVPSLMTSFKLGGSAMIKGAMVRDEKSAVVGKPGAGFTTAPVNVTVRLPNQPERKYQYQVVHHHALTPAITAAVMMQSLTAVQNLPAINTVRLRGTLTFAGGEAFPIDTLIPGASPSQLMMDLVPPIAMMAQNQHEPVELEAASFEIDVEPVLRAGTLINASIDRYEVAPGQQLEVAVRIQPMGSQVIRRSVQIKIPEGLEDGQYELGIVDAQTYLNLWISSRPHLLQTNSADDLLNLLRKAYAISNTSLYVVLQLPEEGLALGRQEMPQLPSSRRAIIATPTSTAATAYTQWLTKPMPLDMVVNGSISFSINVNNQLAR